MGLHSRDHSDSLPQAPPMPHTLPWTHQQYRAQDTLQSQSGPLQEKAVMLIPFYPVPCTLRS